MSEDPPVFTLVPEGSDSHLEDARDFSGSGVANYPNGDVYSGQFEKGHKHGSGTYTFADGSVYSGDYLQDVRSGLGKMQFVSQDSKTDSSEEASFDAPVPGSGGYYHGYFSEGLRNGFGTMVYKNGDVYGGEWVKGKREGTGDYVFNEDKSGYFYRGKWAGDKMVEGKWVFQDNEFWYEGVFANNKPSGSGQFCRRGYEGYGLGDTDARKKLTNPGYCLSGYYTQEVLPVDGSAPVEAGQVPTTRVKSVWTSIGMSKRKM